MRFFIGKTNPRLSKFDVIADWKDTREVKNNQIERGINLETAVEIFPLAIYILLRKAALDMRMISYFIAD
jgi:hypothetical protein